VEEVGLKSGERIEVVVDREKLQLGVPKTQSQSPIECSFDMDEYSKPTPTLLERQIKSCYIQGVDIINITSKKTIPVGWKKQIKNVVVDLIGTVISEEFSNRMKIRTLVDAEKFPVYDLIKRMYMLVFSMHKDAVTSLRDKNPDMAIDVINREKEVEKLYTFVIRHLAIAVYDREVAVAIGAESVINGAVWVIVARDIHRMGYYAADIASQTSTIIDKKMDEVIMGSLITLSEAVKGMQEEAIVAFLKNSFSLANAVIDKREWITAFDRDITEKILKRVEDVEIAIALTAISKDISRIGSYAVTIAEDTQMGCVTPTLHS
jgi:phosphate uptake regulator